MSKTTNKRGEEAKVRSQPALVWIASTNEGSEGSGQLVAGQVKSLRETPH